MVSGCYLIQMSDGRNILIDSGLPADFVPAPGTPAAQHKTNVIAQLDTLMSAQLAPTQHGGRLDHDDAHALGLA